MHAGINTVDSVALYSTHMNAPRHRFTPTHLHTHNAMFGWLQKVDSTHTHTHTHMIKQILHTTHAHTHTQINTLP